jgi:transposase
MRRLRTLTEDECYCRCYGWTDESVKVFRAERPAEPAEQRLSGERLRLLFERRLDLREPGLAA